jgi:hypothetical protein
MFKLKYVHLLICIFMILLLCIVLFNKCNRNNVCDKFTVGAPCTFGAGAAQDTGDAARAGDAALDAGTDAGADGEAEYEAERAAECERLCIEMADMAASWAFPLDGAPVVAIERLETALEAISDVGCLCEDADEAILDQAVADEPVPEEPDPAAECERLCIEKREAQAEYSRVRSYWNSNSLQEVLDRVAAIQYSGGFVALGHDPASITAAYTDSEAARDAATLAAAGCIC